MPFCHKCGAKLEDGDKFCVECGTTVRKTGLSNPIDAKMQITNDIKEKLIETSDLKIVDSHPRTEKNKELVHTNSKITVSSNKKNEASSINMFENRKRNVLFVSLITIIVAVLVGVVFAVVYAVERSRIHKESKLIFDTNSYLNSVRNSREYLEKDANSRSNVMMHALKEQVNNGNIKEDSIFQDEENQIITFRYRNGALGCEMFGDYEEGVLSGASGTSYSNEDLKEYIVAENEKKADAIILECDQLDNFLTDKLAEKWKNAGVSTIIDNYVTLDDLKNLKGNEIIMFVMHGHYLTWKTKEKKQVEFADETKCFPVMRINEEENDDTNSRYYDDLKNNRIGICNGKYLVTPQFMEKHYKSKPDDLKGSICFHAVCQQMGTSKKTNRDWEKTWKKLSVSSFVAFENSVPDVYAYAIADCFFENLIYGHTAGHSYNLAINKYEDNARDFLRNQYAKYTLSKNNAKPLFFGNKNAVLLCENSTITELLPVEITVPDPTISTTESTTESTTSSSTSLPVDTKPAPTMPAILTPTPLAPKTISVSYKYKKTRTFKTSYKTKKITCSIPQINIGGVDTSKTNAEIYKKLKSTESAFKKAKKGAGSVKYARFEYYIGKGYISLITWTDTVDMSGNGPYFYKHYVYNIDTSDGHIMSKKEALKKFGISESDFTKAVKKKTSVKYDPNGQMPKSEYHEKVNNENAPKNAVPYMNKSGKLCYATKIWVPGGPQAHDAEGVLSSSKTKKG